MPQIMSLLTLTLVCAWYEESILGIGRSMRELTFQNFLQSLKILFSEAKSFDIFLIAIQGWVGGNFHTALSISSTSPYLITR